MVVLRLNTLGPMLAAPAGELWPFCVRLVRERHHQAAFPSSPRQFDRIARPRLQRPRGLAHSQKALARKMSVRKMLRGLYSQNFGSGQGLPLVKTLTQSRGLWARQGSDPGSGESFFWDAFFAATGRAPQTLVWGWSGAWPGVANGGPRGSVGRATFFEFHSTEPHSTLSSS